MTDRCPPAFSTVVFDLDGTLVDSSEDIADALNKAIIRHAGEYVTGAQVAAALGGGPRILVEKCLAEAGIRVTEDELLTILRDYSANYLAKPAVKTRLLDTAGPVLRKLHDRGIRIGVCTNKRTVIAQQVLRALRVADLIDVVIGSDATTHPKPHPRHLLDVIEALAAEPESVLYVGDTDIDAAAATAAGVTYAHVAWGDQGTTTALPLTSFDDLLTIV